MKVRIINGARGVEKTVSWKENKDAALEKKAIRNVDFVVGDEVDGEFVPTMARQRSQFPIAATAKTISDAVKARAQALVAAVVTEPAPVDIDL